MKDKLIFRCSIDMRIIQSYLSNVPNYFRQASSPPKIDHRVTGFRSFFDHNDRDLFYRIYEYNFHNCLRGLKKKRISRLTTSQSNFLNCAVTSHFHSTCKSELFRELPSFWNF